MKPDPKSFRHRLIVPEVVQTSAMDCGPASLRCLLQGFGIPVSYGRLREACQTDVDGTSIDTIEEVAIQLGLNVEQIMIPVEHVLLVEAEALPAVVVIRRPNGGTHFVVAWRRHGQFVQVMDPATGRRWPTCKQFLDQLYVHNLAVSAAEWREWSGSDEFLEPLTRRLVNLRLPESKSGQLIDMALTDPGYRAIATLDAATRMMDSIVRSGGLRPGREVEQVLERFFANASKETTSENGMIPAAYWSVWPSSPGLDGEEALLLRGAVLVRARGRRLVPEAHSVGSVLDSAGTSPPLSPELVAALEEPPSRPGLELLRLVFAEGLLTPIILVAALVFAAGGIVIEAVLLRGVVDLGRELALPIQRLVAMGALLLFVTCLLLLDLSIVRNVLRLGRHVEARLRIAFLKKIPRLGDQYFRSRLTSDMAERGHKVHHLHILPYFGEQFIRTVLTLILTVVGIAWLDPASAPIAVLAVVLILGLLLVAQPFLAERDLRVRNHIGALSRFYLDALLGLIPVRTHGAERAVEREHESLVVEWAYARLGLQQTIVAVEGVLSLVGFGLAVWLLFDHLTRTGQAASVLLLVFWTLNLPVLGWRIALLARQFPVHRNITLRLLEPLGAPEDECGQDGSQVNIVLNASTRVDPSKGVAIKVEQVSVRAAGHKILQDINLNIKPGSQVAIVGPSGAGKSSLVGILLGWHRSATGRVLIDGELLDGQRLARLRQETAWVDPTVQIWNRSLIDNLCYGAQDGDLLAIGQIIEQADLRGMLDRLPDGLQTPLGEGGGLVSGGEGQRVRLGRAMSRPSARLVILDEPFRGLDRTQRRKLLARARRLWRNATLLCITHDLVETKTFDRVLVMDGGQIVEEGAPVDLAEKSGSRYRDMLQADEAVRERLWSSRAWRRLRLVQGQLVADGQMREYHE